MIVVVMGVAGSGKTTVGTKLANALNCTFLEGDAPRPPCWTANSTRSKNLTTRSSPMFLSHLT
jgi:gluconate kinase